ncbi:MAG TPA: aminoglycoside phosphotransferase family protein [Streptosporangiaceae bacterium]
MPGLELPRNLVSRLVSPDADGEQRAWSAELPAIAEELAGRWSLRLGQPFQPGGQTAWVAPARSKAGDRLVLKLAWTHEEALHEAEGLRAWNGNGTVLLYASCTVGRATAMLLEACEPGTLLSERLPPAEQDAVLAGLLRRLWIEPPPDGPFRPLTVMCESWAAEFEQEYATAAGRGEGRLDPGLARAGIELFRMLPETADQDVLLSTDLHHGNVVAATREPWLAIDPTPYRGDPAFDPLQHMLNFPDRLAAGPGRFTDQMAGLLDLDRKRLRHWLFARCVQESAGKPWLRPIASGLAP